MDSFATAHDTFLAGLTPAETLLLKQATSPGDLLAEIHAAEERHRNKSVTRNLLINVDPFLRGIEQYSKAFDVLSNVKPEVLSLLWGGALLVLHVRTATCLICIDDAER
jgi:hypothetical protein